MAALLIPLEDIKRHLRFSDLSPDSELDPYLEGLLDAAVDYCSNYLGRPIPWVDDDGDSNSPSEVFPASVRQAILIVIAELDQNREQAVLGTIVAELPTVTNFLHFYRVGLGV